MPRVLLAALLCLLSAFPARPAASEVRRCALPGGGTVYTDRPCETLGAIERRTAGASVQFRTHRAGCPRTLRDLAFEVSAAIDSNDANRLASVYHWAGMSTAQGYAQMKRLQAIVDRPLVDLQPIYPGRTDDDPYPPGYERIPPAGFRLEQVSKGGSTPIRSVLGLRRHLDCWWVTEGGVRRSRPRNAPPAAPVQPAGVPGQVESETPPVPVD